MQATSESAGDPQWLAERRSQAFERWTSGGMPDRAQHLWRYTDPSRLLPEGFGPALPAVCERRESLELPAGVIVGELGTAASEHAELLRDRLGALAAPEQSRWIALNDAFWRGGGFVYVPRGVTLESPIHLVTRVGGREGGAVFPRLLIVLEAGAELSLVDEQVAGGPADERIYADAVTEIHVADGARLRYAQVQAYGGRTLHSLVQRARLGRDAKLEAITVALGAQVSKVDTGAELAGPGAEAELLGIVFGDGRQHFDHHTVLDHQAPHTTSSLDFRVAVANRAKSAYTGVLRIGKDAVKSDARQENRNLLLSDGVRADSIPELEILTDDVSAAHGVAAGPLDPLQVFYCQCRGMSREEAVHTIVGGFFDPIIAQVPGEEVRAGLRRHVDRKLDGIDVDALPQHLTDHEVAELKR